MATRGSFNTSSYKNLSMQVSWSIQSQSIANNTTTIAWTMKGYRTDGATGYITCGGFKLVIDGVTVLSKPTDYRVDVYNGNVVASGTHTISHNADGTKSFNAYAEAGIYYSAINCSGEETFALDKIARQAVMESVSAFNDEENPKITYSNPLGAAAPSLQAGISLDGTSTCAVAYRDVDKTAGTDTLDLTEAERNVLRAAADKNSRTVWIYLRTRIGETYYYSPLSTLLTIKNPNPTISPTIVDSNSTTVALTGNSSKLVRYYSNAKITFGAAAVKQASLVSKKVTCGTKSLTADGTIDAVESNRFVFTVKDSRGNSTEKEVKPTFVEYVKLSCTLGNNMPAADGSMTVKVTGNYFNGSFGAESNSLNVYYRYKTAGGSYGSWVAMTATKSGNTYSATANLTGLDYQTAYVFEAYAKDALATVYSEEKPVKAAPIFDWGENDFKFNVPVYDEFGTAINNGLSAYTGSGSAAIDPNTTLEHLVLTNTNTPTTGFHYVYTCFYNTKSTTANRAQFALPYSSTGNMYHRYYYSGTWSAWVKIHNSEDSHTHPYITTVGGFRVTNTWLGLYDSYANASSNTSRKGWIGYNDTDILTVKDEAGGGIDIRSPGTVRLYGGGNNSHFVGVLTDRLRASHNDYYYLGDATYKWKAVYAVNGTIQTSDRNQKTNIEEIGQKYIELFDRLLPVSFMFNDAESDRVHIGFVSQDVKAAMDEVGLTDLDFAGFCRDALTEWDEETQSEKEVLDEDGNPVYLYSLRYSEFIALNSRMIQLNRQRIAEQEKEINNLRAELDALKEAVAKLTNSL